MGNSGIIHDGVESSERVEGITDQLNCVIGLCEITAECFCPTVAGLYLLHDRSSGFSIDPIREKDRLVILRKADRDGPADSP
jgi:hypothetical protein